MWLTRLKFWSFSFVLVSGILNPSIVRTDDGVNFFSDGIDYWKSKDSVKPSVEKSPSPQSKFDWKPFLDPNHKEFFREGDYTPPEPFMELVRNPTDQNIKNWFSYIERKNELASRLQSRIQEYVSGKAKPPEEAKKFNEESRQYLAEAAKAIPKVRPDFKRLRFRMYFDSHCPHCKRMFDTLNTLQSQGFFVEARQIDRDTSGLQSLAVPIGRASSEEIKAHAIESVPVLFIGDLERKVVYRLNGYQSVEQIFAAINEQKGGVQTQK